MGGMTHQPTTHTFDKVSPIAARWVSDRLAKANKAAARLGVAPWTMEYTSTLVTVYPDGAFAGQPLDRPYYDSTLTITGSAPRLSGDWEVVAAIDHTPTDDGGWLNVVRSFEEGMTSAWMNAAPDCGHCGRNSGNRIYTVLVRNAAGEVLQVGNSCLKDFTGHADAQAIVNWAVIMVALLDESFGDDDQNYAPKGKSLVEATAVVATAFAATRAFGYAKASDAFPTSDVVGKFLRRGESQSAIRLQNDINAAAAKLGGWDALYALASDAIAFAADYRGNSDYLLNLRTIVTQISEFGLVDAKRTGMLVSLAPTYTRQLEWIAEAAVKAAAEATRKESSVDAPVGRVEVEGTIVKTKTYDGDYGQTVKMFVQGDAGWKVFVSVPKSLGEVQLQDRVRFTATFTHSDDDSTFAFGKRPSKAAYIAAEGEAVVRPTGNSTCECCSEEDPCEVRTGNGTAKVLA
jgi:hypothetical protein